MGNWLFIRKLFCSNGHNSSLELGMQAEQALARAAAKFRLEGGGRLAPRIPELLRNTEYSSCLPSTICNQQTWNQALRRIATLRF